MSAPVIGEETWMQRNRYCDRDEPRRKPERDLACIECLEDCLPLDDFGRCAECRPLEDETCEDYAARIAGRRTS